MYLEALRGEYRTNNLCRYDACIISKRGNSRNNTTFISGKSPETIADELEEEPEAVLAMIREITEEEVSAGSTESQREE